MKTVVDLLTTSSSSSFSEIFIFHFLGFEMGYRCYRSMTLERSDETERHVDLVVVKNEREIEETKASCLNSWPFFVKFL